MERKEKQINQSKSYLP
jgi:hypothetical protein